MLTCVCTAGLLFLGLFLFWSNRHGARSLRQEASERQEASLPRLRPLKAAPIEPLFQNAGGGDDPGTSAVQQPDARSSPMQISPNTSRTLPTREREVQQQNQTSGMTSGGHS